MDHTRLPKQFHLPRPAKQLKLVYKGSNVDDGTFMKVRMLR